MIRRNSSACLHPSIIIHYIIIIAIIITTTTITGDHFASAASNFIEGFPPAQTLPGHDNVLLDGNLSFPTFEAIAGSKVFRMHGKPGKEEKTWFEGREKKNIFCVLPTKCEDLKSTTCLGTQLSYARTSLDITDSYSQEKTLERLERYRALRHVPKCWAVIQPFLCAVFLPKCERINRQDYLYLPSYEMCKITMEPCRLLYNTTFFPDFLKCNETLYPPRCNNEVRELKFNSTGQCMRPLVTAESAANYYTGIDGCGVQCKDPMYTDDEHGQIQKLIGWGGGVCMACNLFTIFTFVIDWQNANKYPGLIIFYINVCFVMSGIGWLAQFWPGSREGIVCRNDGTLRHSEPNAGENLSCVIVFVLVYYFVIAAMVWFIIFTYAWHMSFRVIRKMHERIDKKGSYFHLVAWSLPLVLTITTMALSEVDGNGVVGICFVGYINQPMRFGLLLGPICAVLLVGGYFLTGGMLKLVRIRITSKNFISARASNKIRETIVRMGLCTLFVIVFILATVALHIHELRNAPEWAESLRRYIICRISSTFEGGYEVCKMTVRPSVAVLQLHLLCLFGSGILMSSWVWTQSTLEIWQRFVKRKMGISVEEPMKLQKHKLIAQAFAKRKEFQDQGRLSISFHNSHTDPVGLNFNIDSTAASRDFSSTFAHNLPRFVNRRCALTGAATSSSHGVRRNSVADSEISFSVRHVSVESRRNSIDSQVSVKMIDMKTKVARGSRSKGTSSGGVAGSGKNRRNRKFHRRESSTSVESHSRIYNAKTKSSHHHQNQQHNNNSYKRRSASAGLDPMQINAILGNPKLLLPFLQTQTQMMHSSEDEDDDVNSTSVHVKNIDVCLKQQISQYSDDDDDDDLDDDDLLNRIEMDLARVTNVQDNAGDDLDQRLMVKRMNATTTAAVDNANNTTDDEKMSRSRCKGPGPPGIDSLAIIKTYMEGAMMMHRNNSDTHSSKNSTKTRNSGKSNRSRKSLKKTRRMSTNNAERITTTQQLLKMSKMSNKEVVEVKREQQQQQQQQTFYSPDYGDSSVSSFNSMDFSNVDLMNQALGTLHSSSYSGNSKRSCDVGIQANAHEIVNASGGGGFNNNGRRTGGDNINNGGNKNKNKDDEDDDDDDDGSNSASSDQSEDEEDGGETMCLTKKEHRVTTTKIVSSGGGGRATLKKPHREDLIMSESDKLKMLLLPSPKCQAYVRN